MLNQQNLKKVKMVLRANYIKKGGLNMAIVSVSSEDLNNDVKGQKQRVISRLKNMQEFLSFTPNPEIKEYQSNVQYLEPKEFDADIIKQKAENYLGAQKQIGINKINNQTNKELKSLEGKAEETQKQFDEKIENNKNYYENVIESKKQKLANQGLGRSSIIEQSEQDLKNEEQQSTLNLLNQSKASLAELQNKKAELENQRDEKLANFDIEYAVKLQDKIDKLTQDVENYNQKVTKYNNKLQEEENQNAIKYRKQALQEVADNEKRNQELIRFLNKYGYGNYASFAQNQKVQIVTDFLNSIDKQSALNALLEDDEFKTLIGETAFNRILQQVQEREE